MLFKQLIERFNTKAKQVSAQDDDTARFRSRSYAKVALVIESQYNSTDRVTKKRIESLPITDYMKQKAILFTNAKPEIETPPLLNQLTEIPGIGKSKAKELIASGLKKLSQLSFKKYQELLHDSTKLFLKLKPNREIPHKDIQIIEGYMAQLSNSNRDIIFVGSYRRKKATSRDIDVMLVSNSKSAISTFLKDLENITAFIVYVYNHGDDKASVIVDASKRLKKKAIYKMDIFLVKKKDKTPMLLYSTGSKSHNVMMRSLAKKKGLLLNQKGLFKKTAQGVKPVSGLKNETDYFRALGIKYKKPQDRI